ncbi:MAG: helix-turn-helix transcriptional regulator [Clostridiales bacterium]|nr:helix-turn-helix transcriptional regulator [Clostridiales bacterium]
MLNQNIKDLRKQKGYTQETFAQELNVVRQTVSKWEKGYSVPDAVMLEKIAELLDISVGELLGDAEIKAEDRSELKQISEQLSALNSQFARELARKRRNRKIALIVLGVISALILGVILLCMVPHEQAYYLDRETGEVVARSLDEKLDKAVSKAIFASNPFGTFMGECAAESHFVFGTEEKNETVTVYIIEEYRQFGFINGFFTDVSGGNTPAVLKFNKTDDDYTLISRETAQDGDRYTSSIKKLFPRRYAKKIIRGLSDEENEELWINLVRQAQKYLDSINRNATVCEYGDIKIDFLSSHVETEVSNKICEMRWEYDYNVGNHEKIEDGKRYVYQTEYDSQRDWITFTKFEYDTKEIIDFIAVDGETGEIVHDAPKPEKVKYYKGELDANAGDQFTTVAYYQ